MANLPELSVANGSTAVEPEFRKALGLFDSIMIVAGIMVGSGIFIVSAEISRQVGSAGWLLVTWLITGVLTVAGALSYGELAAMMPEAGGMYVYLREAFSPMLGFLYGWTLLTVIQTGTIAAVAIAFARFSGVAFPIISESRYLIAPIHVLPGYAISLSTAQALALGIILVIAAINCYGVQWGKFIQNLFTMAKLIGMVALLALGAVAFFLHPGIFHVNFAGAWKPLNVTKIGNTEITTAFGMIIAVCVSQTGSLFSADSWHDITFVAGEVRNPRRNLPLALGIGTSLVIVLYLLCNLCYLAVLPLHAIQTAPDDRVATLVVDTVLPGIGKLAMALLIMVSTYGTVNALTLAGGRACYAMAQDGLFFRRAGLLNSSQVPGWALVLQCVWSLFLVLSRTYSATTGAYGNLYSNLLDYVISAALLFYIFTVAGLFRLRRIRPDAHRPYRAWGYPWLPATYIAGASVILAALFCYRTATTWPGLLIIASGVPVYFLLRHRLPKKSVSP
ncbi:APC family permease [Edaphobacter dinghuensis]|uniref:Amino acid transporter n=1 Tax=Edaphobacter dinghuensis TaxID=1560005 RepID=A0A917M0L0_9BACT|nr:amino acid permease [Edaphobacter dinghuensis]GGG69684.1 amino acid transporter [Edaphobacter dinghuensis]